ncbi:hypothetical protein [Mucilaginibacter sp. NFX135]|uniref:hypothetical protein n=1 Tax=Mucilaginibacter sp. NFX135 TaxID=3402687 RepID=UPI003AFB7B52
MKKAAWLLSLSLLIIYNLAAQTHTLNGVYGGIQFSVSPLVGGGMTRNDIVILFRPDGTFNSEMDKPDWKTRVSGRYQVSGSKVTVNYTRGHDQFSIEKNGNLKGSGYILFKLSGLTISPGYYEMKRATSFGGMGTGMVAVGSTSNSGLIFDGKGHFSNSRSAATIVSGDNVGGGSTKNSSGSGDYKLDHGTLTLTYNDGKTEVHNFFCETGDKKPMAAIDGGIYFMKNDNAGAAKTTNTMSQPGKTSTTTTAATDVTGNTDAKSLLLKANSIHGGSELDMIKTLQYSAIIMGIKAVSYLDIPNNKIRIELWENGKMVSVEQEENGDGWQWLNGRKATMPAARIAEMRSTFYSGLLGLRKPAINQMQVLNMQKLKNNTYSVLCKLDGNDYIFAINDQNQLVAEANKTFGRTSVSALSDLRQVQGIMIPFHEVVTSGIKKLVIQYDSFEINPVFNADTWGVPAGDR